MKSVLEKAKNVLGSYVGGRMTDRSASGQVELDDVEPQAQSMRGASIPMAEDSSLEGDDVLFSKNNVLLKYHLKDVQVDSSYLGNISSSIPTTNAMSATDTMSARTILPPHFDSGSLPLSKSLDNHVLVPGFLFVTTRGCNFGTTLILNWAPNSSMKVPSVHDSQNQTEQSPTMVASSHSATCGGDSKHKFASAISIDLCLMEMIRIFYHVDDKGFIVSGELVLKNKEEEFKVKFVCIPSCV